MRMSRSPLWMLPEEVTMSCWMSAWLPGCPSMPWISLGALPCTGQHRVVIWTASRDSYRYPSWSSTYRCVFHPVILLCTLHIFQHIIYFPCIQYPTHTPILTAESIFMLISYLYYMYFIFFLIYLLETYILLQNV